ncbi:MAG: hypothetical protein Q4P29_03945 [Tissierellia bacterium]|nr:hypothetical protein [Tissierellia bacterium]
MDNLNSLTKLGLGILVAYILLKLFMKTLSVLFSWGLPLIAIILIIAGFIQKNRDGR